MCAKSRLSPFFGAAAYTWYTRTAVVGLDHHQSGGAFHPTQCGSRHCCGGLDSFFVNNPCFIPLPPPSTMSRCLRPHVLSELSLNGTTRRHPVEPSKQSRRTKLRQRYMFRTSMKAQFFPLRAGVFRTAAHTLSLRGGDFLTPDKRLFPNQPRSSPPCPLKEGS